MVFPHIIRYDLTLFGLTITAMCTTLVSYRIKSEELKYTKQPDIPAPDKESAEQCEIAKILFK